MNIFTRKSAVNFESRDGVLIPLGEYRGYREDLAPLASDFGYKGCCFRHGSMISIANPEQRESIEYIQKCPQRSDYEQAMGKKAQERLQTLKEDVLVIDTSNQAETVSILRHVYTNAKVTKVSVLPAQHLEKISVESNRHHLRIHQFTYEVLQESAKADPEEMFSLLDAADRINITEDRGTYLLALVEDLVTLVKAGNPLLLNRVIKRNSDGTYGPDKDVASDAIHRWKPSETPESVRERERERKSSFSSSGRESSGLSDLVDGGSSVLEGVSDFFSIFTWRKRSSSSSNTHGGSGGFFSSFGGSGGGLFSRGSRGSGTDAPTSSGSSSGGGGFNFFDLFDGFDF